MSAPGVREDDVEVLGLPRNLRIDAVELVELRGVGADAGGALADRRDGGVELGLAAASDKDPRAAGRELARRRQADAGAAAGDQCHLPLE